MATPKDLDRIADSTLRKLRSSGGRAALGYNKLSVLWLNSYVESQRKLTLDESTVDSLIENLGCYFGRCIIEVYGGHWMQLDGTWVVQFDEKNAVFPFNKLAKHWENGAEDSIRSMFESIPLLYPMARSPKPTKPWWRFW